MGESTKVSSMASAMGMNTSWADAQAEQREGQDHHLQQRLSR